MIDKETYLEELTRYFNSIRDDKYKGEAEPTSCIGVSCDDCIFNKEVKKERKCILAIKYMFDVLEIIENWSKEHPPKKFKVSKLEYDIMRAAIDYSCEEEAFKDVDILYELLINGYFSGATRDMTINYYFDNCSGATRDMTINYYFDNCSGVTRDMTINYYFGNCEVIKSEND